MSSAVSDGPFVGSSDSIFQTFGLPFDLNLTRLGGHIYEVAGHICANYRYCGRDGGFDGSVNRFFAVGNYQGPHHELRVARIRAR